MSTPAEDRRLRWGIIGCGNVCEVKSGPAFYKCANSALVAVMRRDGEKARVFAERHGIPRFYTTVAELVNDPEVDAVYVATPPGGDRLGITKAVAAAGKPCYMEKPLGRDGAEAAEVAGVFRGSDVPLFVAYYRRCMPKFVEIKSALDEGKIGALTSVNVTLHQSRHLQLDKTEWRYDRAMSGGGLLLDVGCHMLDLVDHFVGPIENCRGMALQSIENQGWQEGRARIEDNVRGIWQHNVIDSDCGKRRLIGGSCTFNFSSGGPHRDEVEIVGTKGSIVFSCFDDKPARLMLDGGRNAEDLEAEHPEHVQQPMVQAVTDEILALASGDKLPMNKCLCDGVTAVRTSQVMDQLLNARGAWSDEYV